MADLLTVGIRAPEFSLPATGGQTVSLRDFKGRRHLIMVFYPGNDTPGCNRQLSALRDDLEHFAEAGAGVVAVNPASVASHERYAKKFNLSFPLLSDSKREVAQAFHALHENGTSVQRTVYIIDKGGIIQYAKQGMAPHGELFHTLQRL
ncbi:MAG: peroxiredoxin [Nitrospinae bacterium]|nr:peroxiredoxin [Nitrospinota bacterium]